MVRVTERRRRRGARCTREHCMVRPLLLPVPMVAAHPHDVLLLRGACRLWGGQQSGPLGMEGSCRRQAAAAAATALDWRLASKLPRHQLHS